MSLEIVCADGFLGLAGFECIGG